MNLLERYAKADQEREAPKCVLCANPKSCHSEQGCPNPQHLQFHASHEFRPERVARFAARDLTGAVLRG